MRHFLVTFWSLTLGILPAALAVNQAEPLACDSNNPTYYPRGDHWAKEPSGAAREYHIQRDGVANLSLNAVKNSIDSAFSYWQNVRCNTGNGNSEPLNIAWTRGDDYLTKDRGDNASTVSFNHVIYFIDDAATWQRATGADSLTIALATNVFFTTTGYVVTSDIEFNAGNFAFRANGSGCDANQTSPLCYDLTAIATHEVGHWLGFNHVNCLDAVMYPTATTTKTMSSALPAHEATGACKVYNPLPKNNNFAANWGEACSKNSDCPDNLCITEQIGTTVFGYCTKSCSSDSDCPEAYVCASANSQRFCMPGHRWNGNGSTPNGDSTNYNDDLCKACNSGADCASEFCIVATDGQKANCSKPCTPGDTTGSMSCPSGYNCLELTSGGGACWPESGSCPENSAPPSVSYCGINEMCRDYNGTPNNLSDDAVCACESGLVCFGFLNFGECVPICGDGIACPGANYTCCYAIDETGNCVTTGSAGDYGGCFNIRKENETCLRGDESICASGLLCAQLNANIASQCDLAWDESLLTSRCYQMCASKDDCRAGQECNLCLAVSSTIGLCWPPDANITELKRPLGAKCTKDDECASKFCMKNGDLQACSKACNFYEDSGCSATGDNELGLEFTCVKSTTTGFCWPVAGPVDMEGGKVEEKVVYGCDCRSGTYDPFLWLILFMGAWVLYRRRQQS